MTLQSLNDILLKLGKEHKRENILEFSFALIEWMGLEPASGGTPRLVAPRTQKMREYLVSHTVTNQPQLYRLTSDSQLVRIRFAVLNKVRKESITQLVDNDPLSESFQNTPEILRNVTKAPYFIHFITTSEYDKLIVIFNKGEQKRVISFKERLTNTQYFKIVNQWAGISQKPKTEIENIFWKSLDVKEVNKEFYKKIKERYDALVSIVKRSVTDSTDEQVKQFSIRLIGRYIFCWFLKEKGIIPGELINSEKVECTKNYFQTYLRKLFFDTLNTKVPERIYTTNGDSAFEKIPYLNGGLFDENSEDLFFKSLNLDDWLLPFVNVLESFDFTVDESSSTYQQVAVDPEMLGRIFENLLASQNPETEKIANDERKAFGAFYTPREIVEYMTEESIKTHIANKLNISPHELDSAFASNAVWPEKLNKRKQEADNILKNIKILDPACGSGAFPMGILHRLITLRELTGFYPRTYELKKEILSNNIYGIDIMPMAVDIARLRAWLSLVVEIDYNPDKPRSNFGVDSLPNLDFKFMQGNSLLETYEGVKIFDDKLLDSNSEFKENEILNRAKEKLNSLQKEYLQLSNGKKLTKSKQVILDNDLKSLQKYIKRLQTKKIENESSGLFVKDSDSVKISEKLYKLHREFFLTSDKEQKRELRNEIEELEWSLIVTSLEENGKTEKIEELNKLRKLNIKPYFIYKLNFPEVFSKKKGFDIVIGNPPFVEHKKLRKISSVLKNEYITYSGTADLYVYFYEKGINLLSENGVLCLISSNKFVKTNYGLNLRKFLLNYRINSIVDFTRVHIFDALVSSCIMVIQKVSFDNNNIVYIPTNDEIDISGLRGFILNNKIIVNQNSLTPDLWLLDNADLEYLKNKIDSNSTLMKDIEGVNVYRGVTTGYNPAFIIDNEERKYFINFDKKNEKIIKPLLQGRNIKKWNYFSTQEYLLNTEFDIDIPNDFIYIYKHLLSFENQLKVRSDQGRNWWNLRPCQYYSKFENEKIIWGLTADKWAFAYDDQKHYLPSNGYILTSEVIPIKYLLSILNSRLMEFYFGFIGVMTAGGAFTLKHSTIQELPVKLNVNYNVIITLADFIIKEKKQNKDTSACENKLNSLVFKLYDLSYNEVKIIEADFWLTEEEYFNIVI